MLTKEDILKEIRRTTKDNGGKPLGKSTFKNATDISPFDCSRYWAKFSDAIKEAGFEPNKRWTRYPDKLLIEKTIEKIRKYGRYPTLGELFVEFNKGDNFPFHIFKKRSQPYMVKKVLEYCDNKAGYEDIVEACKPIFEKLNNRDDLNDIPNNTIGFVYLGKRGYHYKVGVTKDLPRRKTQLETLQPEDFEYLHVIKTDDPYKIETYWKDRFNLKLVKGTKEWFKLNSSDIKAFKRWKKIF